jgi:hypothetical protein
MNVQARRAYTTVFPRPVRATRTFLVVGVTGPLDGFDDFCTAAIAAA